MSRRKTLPTAKITGTPVRVIPKSSEAPAGVWMLGYGEITPDVDPIDLQERRKASVRATIAFERMVAALMERKNLDEEVARKIVQAAPMDYLDLLKDDDQVNALAGFQPPIDRVTSLFFRHRLLYAVEVIGVDGDAVTITDPAWFDLRGGDWLSHDGTHYQITECAGQTLKLSAKPNCKPGDQLFLLQPDRSGLEVGDPDWTDALSRMMRSDDKQKVLEFYQREAAGVRETEAEEQPPLPIASDDSKNSPPVSQSTGTNSTGESSPTASMTIDSATETMVAAHAA